MSPVEQASPGKTRSCPHCRATILQSASICPVCEHSIRFDALAAKPKTPSFVPLRVEGTIKHPAGGDAWEYSVIVSVRNERGEEVARQSVAVGSLSPSEQRTFTLAVEMFTPGSNRSKT